MVTDMTSAHGTASSDEAMTPVQFRTRLGISRRTLQRWVARGIVAPAFRTPTGHARYTSEQVDTYRDQAAAESESTGDEVAS